MDLFQFDIPKEQDNVQATQKLIDVIKSTISFNENIDMLVGLPIYINNNLPKTMTDENGKECELLGIITLDGKKTALLSERLPPESE